MCAHVQPPPIMTCPHLLPSNPSSPAPPPHLSLTHPPSGVHPLPLPAGPSSSILCSGATGGSACAPSSATTVHWRHGLGSRWPATRASSWLPPCGLASSASGGWGGGWGGERSCSAAHGCPPSHALSWADIPQRPCQNVLWGRGGGLLQIRKLVPPSCCHGCKKSACLGLTLAGAPARRLKGLGNEVNKALLDALNARGDIFLIHTSLDGQLTLRLAGAWRRGVVAAGWLCFCTTGSSSMRSHCAPARRQGACRCCCTLHASVVRQPLLSMACASTLQATHAKLVHPNHTQSAARAPRSGTWSTRSPQCRKRRTACWLASIDAREACWLLASR